MIDVIAGTQELMITKTAIWQCIPKADIQRIEPSVIDVMQIS